MSAVDDENEIVTAVHELAARGRALDARLKSLEDELADCMEAARTLVQQVHRTRSLLLLHGGSAE
jgi:hypothetical protein